MQLLYVIDYETGETLALPVFTSTVAFVIGVEGHFLYRAMRRNMIGNTIAAYDLEVVPEQLPEEVQAKLAPAA